MASSPLWTSLCTQGKDKGQDGRLKSVSQVVKAETWKKSGSCGQGSKCAHLPWGHRWKPITCWIKAGGKKSFTLKTGRRDGDPISLGIPYYLGQGKNPEKALPPNPVRLKAFLKLRLNQETPTTWEICKTHNLSMTSLSYKQQRIHQFTFSYSLSKYNNYYLQKLMN